MRYVALTSLSLMGAWLWSAVALLTGAGAP